MASLQNILVSLFSLGALGAVAFGVHQGIQSDLFVFNAVEIESSTDVPPYDERTLTDMAQLPIGKVSLFDLDMAAIRRRLMTRDWIKSVRLQKKVPNTLVISVVYRQPKAIVQGLKGALAYTDVDGKVFGKIVLSNIEDLPFLSGFISPAPFIPASDLPRRVEGPLGSVVQNSERMKEAIQFLLAWEESPLNRFSQISSIHWEAERGFRALVVYSMGERHLTDSSNKNNQVRVIVELGENTDKFLEGKLAQLSTVFQHLSGNSIAARQIWADAGKKIVVKTARDS